MKRYIVAVIVAVMVSHCYRYRHHKNHKKLRQPLNFGPMKSRAMGFDPDQKHEIDYKTHPDYKLMGPTLGVGNNLKLADPNGKGYYDPTNPGQCDHPLPLDNSITDMNAHNMVMLDKPRISEKLPLAYYDPTENMDNNIILNIKNSDLYVVPIQMQDDIRNGDSDHLYMKENLKKLT